MVDQEAFLKTLRYALVSFRVTGQKLIAPLSSQFGHGSQPSFVKEEELEKLRCKLDRVRSALKSADDLPISDAFDQHWMRELRDLQRRAEDVLEEIEFSSFRTSQLEDFNFELVGSKDGKRKRQEVCLLFSSFPSECFNLKIERMMERYDEIAADRRDLRLSEEDGLRRGCSRKRLATTSLTKGELYGREKDLKGVRELLLRDDSSNRSFGSICIVGMPGVGKTALVQHLYQDETVQNRFDDRFWICASQDFDAENITRTIIQGFVEDTRDQREFNLLQDTLLRLLTGKRVLLVLDDVWVSDENRDWVKSNWESLEASLNRAAKGSKVIFTTQNMNVSTIVKSTHVHDLICLPDEICWLISKRRVFEGRNTSTCSSLEPIGREIVKKSKGLPLAAKVIGDFLPSAADEEKWLHVLRSELWSNDQLLSEILSPLQVAYNRLPPYLKRCYAYCSLFPKGYAFEKEQLIRVWIGQEFVEAHRHLQREEVGGKYFDELVSRCFFQMDGAGVERYVMHDLFHELIQSIAHECCRIEGHKLCDYHEKARHLSLVPPCLDLEKTIEFQLQNEKDLQSLLLISRTECKSEHESFRINVSTDLFSFVKCLRALDLSHTNIKELPRSVNHLIHLRYLVLKKTKLQRLPESICGLFKLQTLDLKDCYSLNELPWGIKHLLNLRHLELPMPKCSSVYIPPGIGKLFNLVELPIFFVTSDSRSCRIGELNNLENLENELQILGLQNICDKEEAEKAKLINKAKLKRLTLQWSISPCSSEMVPSKSSYMVLEGLQPNENLQHLTIRGFCGSKLPKWVGDRRFAKLVKITLEDCWNCDELPPLGQLQVLRHLLIQNLPKLKNVGPEFCGGTEQELDHTFPALEILEFIMMDALEKWDGVKEEDLPLLHTLTIMQCNKLKTLPQLRSVRKLHVKHSPQLHELPLLPSLQHMHICSGCPLLFQSCQLHCFNKEKSCEKVWVLYYYSFESIRPKLNLACNQRF
ncbi:disease resistance RPP13-like protein 1 [Carex littledalei]|uniref:Disease resistance RPP13-like protein 1 n=1 Tax=Carex littledalei TaxID=544730 RepID=A0A833QA43_9POAL|nr:disease resistance RPP13-like protein 1 [Carex littledalei]